MSTDLAKLTVSLDVGTMFVAASWVTLLLGLILLLAWMQERIQVLAWWGTAYLIGGSSGIIWQFGDFLAPSLPSVIANILLFVALGMIWSAARVFHGRPVLWGAMFLGAAVWLVAWTYPAFAHSAAPRVIASILIVAGYTFLIAAELWRERRRSLIRRWPAVFVPLLHGAVFLFPLALATLSSGHNGASILANGWIAVLAIEIVLYVIGAAFIVLVLAKDRTVGFYKVVAASDPLTGLLNRRGFFEAADILRRKVKTSGEPLSVLAFDLDHFKSINDRFGHAEGDRILELFSTVVRRTMRADDVIARFGGEEFIAILPGMLSDAAAVAERVRSAFAAAGAAASDEQIAATVSVGVACGAPSVAIEPLIARADAALYRAKMNGRNCVETANEAVAGSQARQTKEEPEAIARRASSRGAVVPKPSPAGPAIGKSFSTSLCVKPSAPQYARDQAE